jgi:thiamine-phosphate pyrophosphorylase
MQPSLFLISPILENAAQLGGLDRAISSVPFASVWLRLALADDRRRLALAREGIAIVQQRQAAALVDADDPRFAARAGADGLHLRYSEPAFAEALRLRPDRIVGVGGLKQRDDAMSAGEAGADYVMFGEPMPDGFTPPLAKTLERCRWWAEIFETPCIGYAADVEAAAAIAGTGAEFIALGPWFLEASDIDAARIAALAS